MKSDDYNDDDDAQRQVFMTPGDRSLATMKNSKKSAQSPLLQITLLLDFIELLVVAGGHQRLMMTLVWLKTHSTPS